MGGFTYFLTDTLGQVRLELGDNTYGEGVLPDGRNFTDAEINYYLAQNENSVSRTVGALASVLARRYAMVADVSVGPRSESLSQISKAWERQASLLAGGDEGTAFSLAPTRVDGFTGTTSLDDYDRVWPYES
jgi:hypothetical protein